MQGMAAVRASAELARCDAALAVVASLAKAATWMAGGRAGCWPQHEALLRLASTGPIARSGPPLEGSKGGRGAGNGGNSRLQVVVETGPQQSRRRGADAAAAAGASSKPAPLLLALASEVLPASASFLRAAAEHARQFAEKRYAEAKEQGRPVRAAEPQAGRFGAPSFGAIGLRALQVLFSTAAAAQLPAIWEGVQRSGALAAAVDAFEAYPWHSQLHVIVEAGLRALLEKGTDAVRRHVLFPSELPGAAGAGGPGSTGGCALPAHIMRAFDAAGAPRSIAELEMPPREREKARPALRIGYLGHYR